MLIVLRHSNHPHLRGPPLEGYRLFLQYAERGGSVNTVKRFGYTAILGWSASRYETFQACKRQYYYTYYAKYDPTHTRERIDTLKRMTTVPLETGNIVHDVIEVLLNRLIKTDASIETDRFRDYVYRKTMDYCRSKTFAEEYYRETPSVDIEEIFGKVRECLDNFMKSERFDWLIREAIGQREKWLIEPGGYGETRIDGLKAYCKVDFLFPLDDRVFIMDWKTGKPNETRHRKQLMGYASWASFHLMKDPDRITPVIAYLYPAYSEKHLTFNEFDLQEFHLQVRKETEEMYAFCRNPEENTPREKDVFLMTSNRIICDYCNFRELCS